MHQGAEPNNYTVAPYITWQQRSTMAGTMMLSMSISRCRTWLDDNACT